MIGDRAPWSLVAAQVGFDLEIGFLFKIQNSTNKQRGKSIFSQNLISPAHWSRSITSH